MGNLILQEKIDLVEKYKTNNPDAEEIIKEMGKIYNKKYLIVKKQNIVICPFMEKVIKEYEEEKQATEPNK